MNDSAEYISRIFQNIINSLCHDIINPLNSIMICNDIGKNEEIKTIIHDCTLKILNCINIGRYLYGLGGTDFGIPISQIANDWRKIFLHFDILFDKKIDLINQNIITVCCHILYFLHDFFDSKEKITIENDTNSMKIIFEKNFNEKLLNEIQFLITAPQQDEEITPINCQIHFLHYVLWKNCIAITARNKEIHLFKAIK